VVRRQTPAGTAPFLKIRACHRHPPNRRSGVRIEVINTGTELLLGNTLNTHGAWFGRQLFMLGLRVQRQTTVPDGPAIREALEEAILRSDAVLVTGGLGPTSDDLTREICAEVLGAEMILDEAALRSIEAFFGARNRTMAEANRKQAFSVVGADVLPNGNGTAPGLYIPPRLNGRSNCAIFLLPGPPRELHPMFNDEVAPRLRALSGADSIHPAIELKFVGIGESDFHQGVDEALSLVPGLEFGYCARVGEVDLRLICDAAACEAGRAIAIASFHEHLVSDDGSTLEETVVRLLSEQHLGLAIAESCTGGLIASRITDVPGASAVFTHGFVTYSNDAKVGLLGVSPDDLAFHGAVSETVARQMAEGALAASGADIAVSVTGIAGPTGGSAEKPVGTAWIAVSRKGGSTRAFRVLHPRSRKDFKLATSQSALDAVRRALVRIG
jgi:nicotinamide-nucleotide amidase